MSGPGVLSSVQENLEGYVQQITKQQEDGTFANQAADEFSSLKETSMQIKSNKTYSTDEAEKTSNRTKNRYKDIVPFDYNRVNLQDDGTDGGNYINASFIKGRDGRYIASQGPLPVTTFDFWRMVLQNRVTSIMMVCNEFEDDKPKCSRYWPLQKGDTEQFGDVMVTLTEESDVCSDYVVRTLVAERGGLTHTVNHFHLKHWPDHGVKEVDSVLQMIAEVREQQQQHNTPIIVHCSAGCGRTGTIIAIDHVWNLLKQGAIKKEFRIFDIVKDLRSQRTSMVQSKDQYEFVQRAVAELFQRHLKLIQQHLYVNVGNSAAPDEEPDEVYEDVSGGSSSQASPAEYTYATPSKSSPATPLSSTTPRTPASAASPFSSTSPLTPLDRQTSKTVENLYFNFNTQPKPQQHPKPQRHPKPQHHPKPPPKPKLPSGKEGKGVVASALQERDRGPRQQRGISYENVAAEGFKPERDKGSGRSISPLAPKRKGKSVRQKTPERGGRGRGEEPPSSPIKQRAEMWERKTSSSDPVPAKQASSSLAPMAARRGAETLAVSQSHVYSDCAPDSSQGAVYADVNKSPRRHPDTAASDDEDCPPLPPKSPNMMARSGPHSAPTEDYAYSSVEPSGDAYSYAEAPVTRRLPPSPHHQAAGASGCDLGNPMYQPTDNPRELGNGHSSASKTSSLARLGNNIRENIREKFKGHKQKKEKEPEASSTIRGMCDGHIDIVPASAVYRNQDLGFPHRVAKPQGMRKNPTAWESSV